MPGWSGYPGILFSGFRFGVGGHRGAVREESFPISSFIGIPIPVPLSTSSVHFAGWIGNEGWRKESK